MHCLSWQINHSREVWTTGQSLGNIDQTPPPIIITSSKEKALHHSHHHYRYKQSSSCSNLRMPFHLGNISKHKKMYLSIQRFPIWSNNSSELATTIWNAYKTRSLNYSSMFTVHLLKPRPSCHTLTYPDSVFYIWTGIKSQWRHAPKVPETTAMTNALVSMSRASLFQSNK